MGMKLGAQCLRGVSETTSRPNASTLPLPYAEMDSSSFSTACARVCMSSLATIV